MWVKQVIFFLCCNFSFALDTVGATFLTCSANFTLLQFEMRNAEDTSLKIKCHNQLLEATQKAVTGLLNYMYEGFLIAELSPFACRECAALWAFKAKHLAAWRGTEGNQITGIVPTMGTANNAVAAFHKMLLLHASFINENKGCFHNVKVKKIQNFYG